MKTFTLEEIKQRINLPQIIAMQEEGFSKFSAGEVDVPPVGYLKQYNPPGAYHIKYGLIQNDDIWVAKIAGGPETLPLSGIMIVFSTQTGQPQAILQDNGYLTQLRTAVAGLISAKYLAPKSIKAIGVLGTGAQARLQVEILRDWTACRKIYVWGRNFENVESYKKDMENKGFSVKVCQNKEEIAQNCNLIITTTSARKPILQINDIRPGTHITAIGADEPGKIELAPEIIARADIVVVDSKAQCIDHGEIAQAYECGLIADSNLHELGDIVGMRSSGRMHDKQITVADLTGVAVQDIQIAKAILMG